MLIKIMDALKLRGLLNVLIFFKDLCIHFRQRRRKGEREGEKHQCVVASYALLLGTWPATQACALTGNQTGDPLVLRTMLNPLSHTSQGL